MVEDEVVMAMILTMVSSGKVLLWCKIFKFNNGFNILAHLHNCFVFEKFFPNSVNTTHELFMSEL